MENMREVAEGRERNRGDAVADWQVYIILCSDGTLYTGCSTDAGRRLALHAGGRGAKYFRGRRPLRLVYVEGGHSRSTAGTEEVRIKSLGRAGKLRLIASAANEIPEGERGHLTAFAPSGKIDGK